MDQTHTEKKMYVALGLMSGTSMDGIDVAMLRTNGKNRIERGPFVSFPYTKKFRTRLEEGLRVAVSINARSHRPGDLRKLEDDITLRHVRAVRKFLDRMGLRLSDVDIIGFHGQTVIHRPEIGLTVQLGLGQLLADRTGLPVVYDLRAMDMTHGGQGAPLACAYHQALARNLQVPLVRWPAAFVNIGGISNFTWIPGEGAMIAFDAGPGNMLIDMWMQAKAGKLFDKSGNTAARGRILRDIVDGYLALPYFDLAPPKSLDRGDFRPLSTKAASLEDGARTLARVTAASLIRACDHVAAPPALWIVSGGGVRNRAIMDDLAQMAAERSSGDRRPVVMAASELGLDSDAIEAEAWAYLAVRSLRGLKITWPGTTGVASPVTGGVLALPSS